MRTLIEILASFAILANGVMDGTDVFGSTGWSVHIGIACAWSSSAASRGALSRLVRSARVLSDCTG